MYTGDTNEKGGQLKPETVTINKQFFKKGQLIMIDKINDRMNKRDLMKAEALRRLEYMKVNPRIIEEFSKGTVLYSEYGILRRLLCDLQDKIEELEHEYDVLVYHVLLRFRADFIFAYELLVVSNNPENWSEEIVYEEFSEPKLPTQLFKGFKVACYEWNKNGKYEYFKFQPIHCFPSEDYDGLDNITRIIEKKLMGRTWDDEIADLKESARIEMELNRLEAEERERMLFEDDEDYDEDYEDDED